MKIVQQQAYLQGLEVPAYIMADTLVLDENPSGPERLIENSGRTCYRSECRATETSHVDFIGRLQTSQHTSVLEHSHATIRMVTDRGISHELVRHRLAAYSQESTRYCNYTKDNHGGGDIEFILPSGLDSPEAIDSCLVAYEEAELRYNHAIRVLGLTPQQARDLLPNGLKTEIVMSCNFREWLHFLELRTSKAAHPKMQELAWLVARILVKVAPTVFGKFREAP